MGKLTARIMILTIVKDTIHTLTKTRREAKIKMDHTSITTKVETRMDIRLVVIMDKVMGIHLVMDPGIVELLQGNRTTVKAIRLETKIITKEIQN